MKAYEAAARTMLPGRLPVILRVDGKAFHTYTRGCRKPFDERLQNVMNDTAVALCDGVQGSQMAYVQSDEISVLIHGYKKLTSSPWFDNQTMKMVSIAAAIASTTFTMNSWKIWAEEQGGDDVGGLHHCMRTALFDARVFVLPEAEVCNYFIWRQQDAIRNSVQMLARAYFSHKDCDGKNIAQLKETLSVSGVNWDSLSVHLQRGRCVRKQPYSLETETGTVERTHWGIDYATPDFIEERSYVNDLLRVTEE